MSAYKILIRELAQHAQTTYKALCKKYPEYDYFQFTQAFYKARRLGFAEKAPEQKKLIVAAGCCPYCGRKL